ncbi:MAG: 50S ribosomal protein L24 [Phycisphaeraceae bacterium]|nr:50S ribosomal protein L24 [Phycisphaeraceae bacterium]
MPQHIRKGDVVMVTSGKARGQRGTVLRVLKAAQRVLVEGVNVRKRHVRPSQNNPQGGIIQKEMPIHISNVSPLVDEKPTRVRFKVNADGSKVRLAAKSGQTIGSPLRKAR